MKHQGNNWSKELKDYKEQKMNSAEKYQLEKSALDDAFLFDALEGYTLYDGVKSRNKISPNATKKEAKIFSMRNMAVAASFLALVAIVGYVQTSVSNEKSIVEASDHIEQDTESESIAMNVVKGNEAATAAGQLASESSGNASGVTLESPPVQIRESIETENSVTSEISKKTENTEIKLAPQTKPNIKANTPVKEEKRKATKVRPTTKDQSLSIPKSSREQLLVDDAAESAIKTYKNEKPTIVSMDQVRQKKTTESKNKTLSIDTDMKVSSYSSVVSPPGGWKAMSTYITKNKKAISTLKSVIVTVSFEVDKYGTVSSVKSSKTTCGPCEKEAVRLIANSGIWKNLTAKTEKITYNIKF